MNMYNQYMTMQDLQGISPVMQNTQGQQSSIQQALAQGNQLASQALGQTPHMDPQKMADALRNNNPTQPSQMQKQEINGLGSNTWNPYSDYNRGTNGWGNYGE